MKKVQFVLAVLLVACVAFQGAVLAGMVEGTVSSVDATAKSLLVATAAGDSSVTYSDMTTWPEGVTDPASLVGKTVKVSTDDATGEATAVEEAIA